MKICLASIFLSSLLVFSVGGTQNLDGLPSTPFRPTPETPGLDDWKLAKARAQIFGASSASGPIATAAAGQPKGALSGRIVYTSAGHGWVWMGSNWALGRPVLNAMSEDYGNLDQMTIFAYYCFNAGATVVPMRPIGHQANEVVLDNTSASVTWRGAWADSTSTVYYGSPGAVPYRFTAMQTNETATATYTPTFPEEGLYPVYTWVLSSWNRGNQLYKINHTGGQSTVRVPHDMVGNGWVYLGSYYFNAGSNQPAGSVMISNYDERPAYEAVVVADAIRFGNGMGDVDRGGGISGYPREEECSRYWVQRSLGQGQSSTIYDNPSLGDDSDNVGAPIRMAVEMNRESAGSMYKRAYVGFHSNAGGGRGVLGLYNNPNLSTNVARNSNTPNQFRLAQLLGTEVNTDLAGLGTPPLEVAWYNRGTSITYARSDYAFGEINNNTITNEFDASMVEVAFHDDVSDARLMRDPKVRNWVARAALQALVRYFNQFDGLSLNFLPEPPSNVRATATNQAILLSWSIPTAQSGSGTVTGYVAYVSRDGYGFGDPVYVLGTATSVLLTNLSPDVDYYFRIAALNAGGESFPSETVGCRRSSNALCSKILFVNGFTRFDRGLNLHQTAAAQNYRRPGHDQNTGTMERVLPCRANAFNYVTAHGKAIASAGLMGFDACQLQAITNSQLSLESYPIVIWASGNQSTADKTFNANAQAKVQSFLARGGHLFVSGSEIAWDLDRASGPSAADRDFLHNQLHAALGSDANDDSGTYGFAPSSTAMFRNNSTGEFDDGSRGIYCVGYPDALVPVGSGAVPVISYPGLNSGSAGIAYSESAGEGRVVYFGFPFETITSTTTRAAYMADILRFMSRKPVISAISMSSRGMPRLKLTAEPGLTYTIEYSSDLLHWSRVGAVTSGNGEVEWEDPSSRSGPAFFRAILEL